MRIRSIKPEFWRSEDVVFKDWHTRLVFIGIWSYVDDNGVGLDKLSDITADLFAHDLSIDPTETLNRVSTALDYLQKGGQITRYQVDGKRYLYVSKWEAHQRVNNPNKPRFPPPPVAVTSVNVEPTATLNSSSVETMQTLPPGAVEQWSSGTEEQGLKASPPVKAKRYPDDFEEFWQAYPRHENKADAAKAFATAKKHKDATAIITAAGRYKADPNLPDENFIPYPAKWLRAGGWDNGPCSPRTNGTNGQAKPSTTNARVNEADAAGRRLMAALGQLPTNDTIPLEITA